MRNGNESYYSAEDRSFLTSIGHQPREFFDFVEDACEDDEPSASCALLVASVRRDFFLAVQEETPSDKILTRDGVPNFGEELEGMPHLPRILAKARAKLLGELDSDLMFG